MGILLGMGSSELYEDVSDSVTCLGCFEDYVADLSLLLALMLPFFCWGLFLVLWLLYKSDKFLIMYAHVQVHHHTIILQLTE